MEHKDLILTLDQVYESGMLEVGTKVSNLARCNQANYMVPKSLVLRTQAFLAYLQGKDLKKLFQTIERHFVGYQNWLSKVDCPFFISSRRRSSNLLC